MARTLLKPLFVSNRVIPPLTEFCQVLRPLAVSVRLGYMAVMGRSYLHRFIYLQNFFMRAHLGYRGYYKIILQPHTADSVLKLYQYIRIWQFFASKFPRRRRSRRQLKRWSRKFKYYFSCESMMGRYLGEFKRTRSHQPFKWHVNKKKFTKLKKDLAKARKKRLHNVKELHRLSKKARSITRARQRGISSRPVRKFWGPAVFHSEKKSGVSRRKAIRAAVVKRRKSLISKKK